MLGILLRIAIRNLSRNTRRTLITACGLAIGTFVIIFARGLLNGLQDAIVHGVTETRLGDAQLHRTGYLESFEALPLTESFPMDHKFQALIATDPRITEASGRIQFSGLVSVGDVTSLFFGLGIDPAHEYSICKYQKENVLAGGPLRTDIPDGVVVGKPLADAMQIQVGSEITALVTTRHGSMNAIDLRVVGIIEYKLPGPGSRVLMMPLGTAQKLLHMDQNVTEAILNVSDLAQVEAVSRGLKKRLATDFKGMDIAPNTWMDVGQQFLAMIEEQEYVLKYIVAIMYIMMMSGIINTMMMSVFERTRELGTMMAMGVKRGRILTMILLEAAVLGTIGATLGVSAGTTVVETLHRSGFPIFPVGQATQWYRIYPRITVSYVAWVVAVAMVTGAISALYPAWRASRLRPAQALHEH